MAGVAKIPLGRKIFATLVVAAWVLCLQLWINFRMRPAEPKISFPKDLQAIKDLGGKIL